MTHINPSMLSAAFEVIDASQADFEELFRLFRSNLAYFDYFSIDPTREALQKDMTMLPDGCTEDQKHFLVYRDADGMAALMDLIEGYPDDNTCYVGLFMVHADRAGQGIGTAIITELSSALRSMGYKKLRLAYGKHYRHAEHFWTKNGFIPAREAFLEEYGELIVAERIL